MRTPLTGAGAGLELCICRSCTRLWLERDGWLLSRREAAAVLRKLPAPYAQRATR